MDKFKSAIFVRDMSVDVDDNDRPIGLNMTHDLFGNDQDEVPPDELYIDTAAWGWWDGGLAKLLRTSPTECGRVVPIYFRGAAMFDNADDAKNDYLMDPLQEVYRVKQVTEDQHLPFGMIIPTFAVTDYADQSKNPLIRVTIILWWHELT
jgi:hypothetical protein